MYVDIETQVDVYEVMHSLNEKEYTELIDCLVEDHHADIPLSLLKKIIKSRIEFGLYADSKEIINFINELESEED